MSPARRAPEEDAHVGDHPAIGVVERIEDEGARLGILGPAGRRDPVDDRLEDLLDPDAGLAAGEDGLLGGNGENVLELARAKLEIRTGQVDLVDHRDDLELLGESQVGIGHGLRLNPLRGVNQQQRALARGQAARDLVGEVDVAGRVHEVELVRAAIFGAVMHRHRMGLDRDPALLLQVHRVEVLRGHDALRHRVRVLQQPVGERGLPVVNVGDDAEIACEGSVQGKVFSWRNAQAFRGLGIQV